jgi:hypothetical protein
MPEWTFFTNHAPVLSCIARHPRMTARDLATSPRNPVRGIK